MQVNNEISKLALNNLNILIIEILKNKFISNHK